MYSVGLFIVQLLIIAVFVILFWFVKEDKIGFGSASILLAISIAVFVILPGVAAKLGFIPAIVVLILFVIFGMELVMMLEEKKFKNFKLNEGPQFFDFSKMIKRLNLSKGFKFLEGILSFKKVEEIIRAKEDNKIVINQEDKDRPIQQNILQTIVTNEDISYVDFDKKDEQYGDVFSKFIRGEIPASEVRERIQNKNALSAEELVPEIVQETEPKKPTKKTSSKSKKKESASVSDNPQAVEKTVEKYVDLAFNAKKEGHLIQAVEFYIQALEKKPEEQLILWIIIDVCSIYKELGQENLAKEMIQSYIDTAGESISQEVKDDLIKNFGI